jgi:hypothetical protein
MCFLGLAHWSDFSSRRYLVAHWRLTVAFPALNSRTSSKKLAPSRPCRNADLSCDKRGLGAFYRYESGSSLVVRLGTVEECR